MRFLCYFFLFSLNGLGLTTMAQPDWSVNPHAYEFTMTITGKVVVDGVLSTDQGDVVGVFAGDECRGVTPVAFDQGVDGYFAYLMVYSNKMGETLNFRVYDASRDEVLSVRNALPFTVNGIVGSPDEPYLITTVSLSPSAEWPGQKIRIFPNPFCDEIRVEIPEEKGNLWLNLTTSDGRLVKRWAQRGSFSGAIGTHTLPPGLYFLEWRGPQSAGSKKLIKN